MKLHEIPIFCINLERAKERKKTIIDSWINKFNFEITFFDAFDKKKLELSNHIYKYDKEISLLKINRQLTLGEIACVTSFCILCEKIQKLQLDEAIFLEDDVFPIVSKEYFFNVINEGKKEFPEAEVFLLTQNEKHNAENNNYFSLLKTHVWGNHLFYINKNGIERMYESIVKMQYPADFVWDDVFTPNRKAIICNAPLAYHEGTTTYIGNEYRKIKRKYIN